MQNSSDCASASHLDNAPAKTNLFWIAIGVGFVTITAIAAMVSLFLGVYTGS